MLTHPNLLARARHHRTSRHRHLRNDSPDVWRGITRFAEHFLQIVNDGLGRSDSTARRVEDEVKALATIQLVNGHHETVLVLIIDFCSGEIWLGKETRIISNHIPVRFCVQLCKIIMSNNGYRIY